jgi:hypothetical protein
MKNQESKIRTQKSSIRHRGVTLALAAIAILILTTLGVGLLAIGYGVRHHAIAAKADAAAMLAAEAGYEKAVFWMGQQQDMLSALQQGTPGTSGSLAFPDSRCTYAIGLYTFVGSRPVFRVVSNGTSGIFERRVDVLTVQMISGWDMGACRIPIGATATDAVNFMSGETIDLPIHINKASDSPDVKDIFIIGKPSFLQAVAMGEDRYTAGGADKYASVLSLFDGGIYFNQPASRVTDEQSVQSKVDRFRNSTLPQYQFTPTATATSLTNRQPAVQLEFFVEGGVGMVRITNNCSVRGFRQSADSMTYDFKIRPGTGGTRYERYSIYAYHVAPGNADATGQRITIPLTNTYVTQSFGGTTSAPGGQIFVNGNVVIGGNSALHNNDQVVKGTVTVVATGNIWVADSIHVDGNHDAQGKPTEDNPNVLGLLAQGVVKVVDPGMSDIDGKVSLSGFTYMPVGRPNYPAASPGTANYFQRYLPDPTTVEAAITVGGGGWGAENVRRNGHGDRKQATGSQDYLRVHGTISESIRGVVGVTDSFGTDGYLKSYHMDSRLVTGIVPGDIWLRGKYVPAPAGWHDYRPN